MTGRNAHKALGLAMTKDGYPPIVILTGAGISKESGCGPPDMWIPLWVIYALA